MTGIASLPPPRRQSAVREHAVPDASSSSDSVRFADLLPGMAVADSEDRVFAGGTMRRSVERFGERGLLATGLVVDARSSAPGRRALPEPGQIEGHPEAAATIAPLPKSVSFDGGDVDGGTTDRSRASRAHMADGLADTPPRSRTGNLEVRLGGNSAQQTISTSHATTTGAAGEIAEPVSETSRPAARTPFARQGAAAVRVGIDRHADGIVDVSVLGRRADGTGLDEAELHGAVAHLLARHGLVLGQLRVTRQPAGNGRRQGRE